MSSTQKKITLDITGMHCGNCVARVAKALSSLEGVEIDSLAIGKAKLRIEGEATGSDELLAAVQRAGYKAVVTE